MGRRTILKTMLTTITPYWGREEALEVWFNCILAASIPEVKHIIYFVNEPIPIWLRLFFAPYDQITAIEVSGDPDLSIGHYHNLGAKHADREWIMKLDIDAIPNQHYFQELLPILKAAKPREWFNGGMIYVPQSYTKEYLPKSEMPVDRDIYLKFAKSFPPQATNFICRREEYLELGGCDPGFKGWGWEDYQQIYMLQKHFLNADPLPGDIDFNNVTQRCRDEISRPKALELRMKSIWLCLLHRWHPRSIGFNKHANNNKKVLLDYIKK